MDDQQNQTTVPTPTETPAEAPNAQLQEPAAPEADKPAVVVPDNAKWYVVHTYSGHENKVATNLKQRVETMGLQAKIFDSVVPTRNTVVVKHGKKEEQKEKKFPG